MNTVTMLHRFDHPPVEHDTEENTLHVSNKMADAVPIIH
jgi:hypothetical protein